MAPIASRAAAAPQCTTIAAPQQPRCQRGRRSRAACPAQRGMTRLVAVAGAARALWCGATACIGAPSIRRWGRRCGGWPARGPAPCGRSPRRRARGRRRGDPKPLALGKAPSIVPASLPQGRTLAGRARRRDGRVAEGARLESVYTGNRIVGSNPTPSARTSSKTLSFLTISCYKILFFKGLWTIACPLRSTAVHGSPAPGQAMAMVLHELVTNAAKYGALSTQSGHVSVRWYRKLNGSAQLILVWQESGGPRVEAPRRSGYGTGVVRDLIPYEFGGTVDLSFPPEGVRCRLEIPFDWVSSDGRRPYNSTAPAMSPG